MRIINATSTHIEFTASIFPELALRSEVQLVLLAIDEKNSALGLAVLFAMDEFRNNVFGFDAIAFDTNVQNEVIQSLVTEIEKVAKNHNIHQLLKFEAITKNEELELYQTLAYKSLRAVYHYEIDIAFTSSILPDYDQLINQNNFAIEKYDKDIEAIDQLCLQGFDVLTMGHLGATNRSNVNKNYDLSFSMWSGEQLVAALAIELEEQTATFDPLLIKNSFFNTKAFAIVIASAFYILQQHNIEKGRLLILSDNKKMMKFAKRYSPKLIYKEHIVAKEMYNVE